MCCPFQDNAPESRQAVALPGTARFVPQAALGLLAADGGDNPVLLNVAGLLGSSDSLMRDSVLHMAAQFRLMQLVRAASLHAAFLALPRIMLLIVGP